METTLTLSLACTQTDRSAPILDGRIPIAGCTIIPLPGQTQDIFRRVLADRAFDIAEMSMSTHIVQVARNTEDYVAVPVFLSRAFRHSAIYIRTDRGIAKPEDLAGKTIGLEQYQQTVALWVRGILADRHDVRTEDVDWRNGGLEQPGGGERLALTLPPNIRLSAIPPAKRSTQCSPPARSMPSSPRARRPRSSPAARTWAASSPIIARRSLRSP